jgi:hypothetical protein
VILVPKLSLDHTPSTYGLLYSWDDRPLPPHPAYLLRWGLVNYFLWGGLGLDEVSMCTHISLQPPVTCTMWISWYCFWHLPAHHSCPLTSLCVNQKETFLLHGQGGKNQLPLDGHSSTCVWLGHLTVFLCIDKMFLSSD